MSRRSLNPADVQQAIDEGRLDEYLAQPRDAEPTATGDADQGARGVRYATVREELKHLSAGEIVRRFNRGDFGPLLRGETS